MSQWKYSDYLQVREDFIPVYNQESDELHRNAWKSFIPHDQFVGMLETVLQALDRSKPDTSRSFWISGQYGTGKTFAAFVLKHMLEDNLDEVRDYMQAHEGLRQLWPRLKVLREKKRIIIPYVSGAGHVETDKRLLLEVQQQLQQELRKRGLDASTGTLLSELLKKIEGGIVNWEAVFRKHAHGFPSAGTPEDVIESIRRGDLDVAEQAIRVLEGEGITLADRPDDLKRWIREIIEKHELGAIVFIWDEFTDYFRRTRTLTTLQELAHLTSSCPFYLFLVTHRGIRRELSAFVSEDARKLEDRFHVVQLSMEPVTAYKLLGNAIRVWQNKLDDWETRRSTLEASVERFFGTQMFVSEYAVTKSDILNLIPIHPYAAFLLATLSRQYSSSQRTLFQFLNDEKYGLVRFLREHPRDDHSWLTADGLWDYFFAHDRGAELRSSEIASEALANFTKHEHKLSAVEQRVAKVLLLQNILWDEWSRSPQDASTFKGSRTDEQRFLRPTRENVRTAFIGEHIRLENVLGKLTESGMFLALERDGVAEYLLSSSTMSPEVLKKWKEYVDKNYDFGKLLRLSDDDDSPSLGEMIRASLGLNQALSMRVVPRFITRSELLRSGSTKAINPELQGYQFGVVFVFSLEEDQAHLPEKAIHDFLLDLGDRWCAVVCETSSFTRSRYAAWADALAHFKAHSDDARDLSRAQYYKERMKGELSDWVKELEIAEYAVYLPTSGGLKCQLKSGLVGVRDYLPYVRRHFFKYAPEEVCEKETLYKLKKKSAAFLKYGLRVDMTVHSQIKDLVDRLEQAGWWREDREFGPDKPNEIRVLYEMQRAVDRLVDSKDGHLLTIWEELQRPPFGLMPCQIGQFLFACVMWKYARGYYLVDEHHISLPLNANALAEKLAEVVAGSSKAAESYRIRRLSKDGEEFCDLFRKLFDLAKSDAVSPEEVRRGVREKVSKELQYPLWAALYGSGDGDALRRAVVAIQEFLSYGDGESDLSDSELKRINMLLKQALPSLKKKFKVGELQAGFERFIQEQRSGVLERAREIGLSTPELRQEIRELLNEDPYLWSAERVAEKLPRLEAELTLLLALSQILGVQRKKLEEARDDLVEKVRRGKLPIWMFAELNGDESLAEGYRLVNRLSTREQLDESDIRSALVLLENASAVRRELENPAEVLARAVEVWFEEKITHEEARSLLSDLPDVSAEPSREVIAERLRESMNRLERRRIARKIIALWKELTSSKTPADWSNTHRIPVMWVLPDSSFGEFCRKFDRIASLSIEELKQMYAWLEGSKEMVAELSKLELVGSRFLDIVAEGYRSLVQLSDLPLILEHITDRCGGDVYSGWSHCQSRVLKAVAEWVQASGRGTSQEAEALLNRLDGEQVKEAILEICRRDEALCVRLVAMLRQCEE